MSLSIVLQMKGMEKGHCLEDTGINVAITASNKNAGRHLWPKSIPPQTSNISTKSVSVTFQKPAKGITILHMPLLEVWPFLLPPSFSISFYPHLWDWPDGRSLEWQWQEHC